jgi:hypothetical protein
MGSFFDELADVKIKSQLIEMYLFKIRGMDYENAVRFTKELVTVQLLLPLQEVIVYLAEDKHLTVEEVKKDFPTLNN